MLQMNYLQKRFGQAVQYLPPRFRGKVMQIEDTVKAEAEEFRLRAGQSLTISTPRREVDVPTESPVRHEELNTVLDIATGGSIHSAAESMKNGFVTVSGGHRIGICGTAVVKMGEVSFIKEISSVAIRIAKEFPGVADPVLPEILAGGAFRNTLIVSPPGCGKTTMLRDLIRLLGKDHRVSIADERGEIAAKYRGVPQFDVGRHTDVMEGVSKASAMMLMLRSMSPQILAADEITAEEDIRAIACACNCGVGLIATAHGEDISSLQGRPLYRKLMELGIFEVAVVLEKKNGVHTYQIHALET